MTTREMEIVSFALSLHLEIDPNLIRLEQDLEQDLGLDPLDLVLIVLRLEEVGDGEFPVGDLEGIHTVKDLVEVVRCWTQGPPTVRVPPLSGMRVIEAPSETLIPAAVRAS